MSQTAIRGWKLVQNPRRVRFSVYGVAKPKGNPQAFRAGDRIVMTENNSGGVKQWSKLIAAEAQRHVPEGGPLDGPLFATVWFYMPALPSAPKTWLVLPDRKPDVDKLLRAILDPLRGVIIADDARLVDAHIRKRYSSRPRVDLWVWEATAEDLEPVEEATAEVGRAASS